MLSQFDLNQSERWMKEREAERQRLGIAILRQRKAQRREPKNHPSYVLHFTPR